MNLPQIASTVYIVDDDEAVRDSLRWLLEANNYRVRAYASAEAFLAEYDEQQPGVLIVDVRMPGMSGLELQEQLIVRKSSMPVVFITGLEKPFDETALREIVGRMFEQANQRLTQAKAVRQHEAMLARLTSREQQVLERIVAGRLNKQIADDLGISIKTVEAHRANIMEKLQVTTVADLMKVALAKPEVNA